MIITVTLAETLAIAIAHELAHYKGLKNRLTAAEKGKWLGLVQERVNSRVRLAALRARRAKLPGWVPPW